MTTVTTTDVAPIYRHGTQLGWLFAQANEHEMPAPKYVSVVNVDWTHAASITLTFDNLDDLIAWAQWADASLIDMIDTTQTHIGWEFGGEINEVRVQAHCIKKADQ